MRTSGQVCLSQHILGRFPGRYQSASIESCRLAAFPATAGRHVDDCINFVGCITHLQQRSRRPAAPAPPPTAAHCRPAGPQAAARRKHRGCIAAASSITAALEAVAGLQRCSPPQAGELMLRACNAPQSCHAHSPLPPPVQPCGVGGYGGYGSYYDASRWWRSASSGEGGRRQHNGGQAVGSGG